MQALMQAWFWSCCHAPQVYNNTLRDLLGGPSAPYIADASAIKHDASGGHTTVVGVCKVRRRQKHTWYCRFLARM
jgi:hypothetical protein